MASTPLKLAIIGLGGGLLPLFAGAETWNALPPPPTAQTPTGEAQSWMLGLMLNGYDTGEVVSVQFQGDHYVMRAGDLMRVGIPSSKINSTMMDVSAMENVKAEYDRQGQRLLLTVPPEWLPQQTFGKVIQNGPRIDGLSSAGALFNYNVYGSQTDGGGSRLSAWNELRLFGGWGQFSNSGILQRQLSGDADLGNTYTRYDTWWSNQNEDNALTLRVGDLVTDSLAWSSSVRVGGIQLARDFSLRPDLITYPLPSFSGQAAVPSTVDLFVNGYRTSSNSVQPGPWSMTNLPFVNGAGSAVVVTTDAQGRQVTTTLPFYVASNLLQSGLSDYAVSTGALRENYGLENFDYGPLTASGSYRYGLTDWLTLESHAEAAESLAQLGGGGQLRVGSLGVVNGSVSQSQMMGQSGNQNSWGYQYSTGLFSVGMQQTLRSSGYGNLALYGDRKNGETWNNADQEYYTLSRRSAQYSASLSLDQYGSLGAALIDITSGNGDRTRLINLTWSRGLWGGSSIYVSASRDDQADNWAGAISLSVPFSSLISGGTSIERDAEGKNSQRLFVSRAMPSDGGFAWDASWANQSSSGDYRQGSLRWRNQQVETSGGFYGDDEYMTKWGQVNGSLVLMDSQLFAANQVTDSFVLVKTGYPNVGVRFENQLQGKTNNKGYLLVPRVTSNYAAKYDIDTLDLPANLGTADVEKRVAVKRQSGYMLDMEIKPLRAASVIINDQHGQPLPVGTAILRTAPPAEVVGWDGIVWMDNLEQRNPIRARTPDGRTCETELTLPKELPDTLVTYGPLVCPLSPPPGSKP
ncbi:fimbria/pilus outer membrane usher protein [Pantoea coffeiphila]|uniref:fimbria/pilus outer membrane usher protein n=1 Tax=Pantoea coffeiphila TaxID=1465635 RepID=UPI003B834B3F|nr:outer membrane usher protein [Pantoea coffeiphila]